jgi:hypothetical protein
MLTPQQRLNVCEEIAAKVIDGEAIIINLANGVYYSLDKAGGMIWEMLEAGHSLAEAVEGITARYDVPREQAQADVERLATELVQENLLRVADDRTPPQHSLAQTDRHELPYETPTLNIYRDMGDLLALDPPTPGFQDIAWKEPKEE